jgi:transcriptional regulator with XRE-family HTH domain
MCAIMIDSAQKYDFFGRLLTEARLNAGIDNQSDLALILGRTQQTVSRWESGQSRPRAGEIPKLAAALKLKPAFLLEKAGYAAPTVTSYAQPFPVDRLDADTFERFVEFFLQCLHRGKAEVKRAGESGHKQDGVDLFVMFPDGLRVSYQCKRVEQFGPADVARAVAAHSAVADKKYLVLSRVPSPQTQDAIRRFPDWEIWGKEDLSRLIRTELTGDDQNRLVDIFFRGQRLSLLGRSEAGPWLTIDEFFAPFVGRGTIFNHDLNLKGRDDEVALLSDALQTKDTPLVLLTGPGGIGKSRLLKDALEAFAKAHPLVCIRFLSSSGDVTRENIEALGNAPKILVIDDAHDRDGLGGLLEHAAVPENQTRLLLATRLYAESRIKREAARTAIENPPTIELKRLTLEQTTELAKAALNEAGGPTEWADDLAKVTRDSPLVTVMAARVIAKDRVSFEAAKNESAFRTLILAKFEDIIVGELGSSGDKKVIKDMLDVLALVQPFHPEDPALIALLHSLRNIETTDAARLFRFLIDGGVIYRRGHHYRLMPDLLGDYLIEKSCIGPDEQLSPFALRAFDLVEPRQLENLLVNLGRLDWRLKGGQPSDSTLLDAVWQRLRDNHGPYDQRINAIRAVAIYQPRQALDFVTDRIRNGVVAKDFSNILRSITYSIEYLPDACEVLWQLGRNDRRELGANPDHPIRALAELCGFDERRPLAFTKQVFDFCMSLVGRDGAWNSHYSPLDVLRPILSSEGVTTHSTIRQLVLKPFLVNPDVVAPLRQQLIERVLELLRHPRTRVTTKAALFLHSALTYPMGAMGMSVPRELRDKYDLEFERTILAVKDLMASGEIRPIVGITLSASVSWHAQHGTGGVQAAAKAVQAALPTGLEFRALVALTKGFGPTLDKTGFTEDWQQRHEAWLMNLSAELKAAYAPIDLHRLIESLLTEVSDSGEKGNGAHILISRLLRDDVELARIFIADAHAHPESHTRAFLAHALGEVSNADPNEGRSLALRFLDSADVSLARAAAASFAGIRRPYDERDVFLIGVALASHDSTVVTTAIDCLWRWRPEKVRQLIDLSKKVHIEALPDLADELFQLFREADDGPLNQLTSEDVDHFLKRLLNIPRLEGYWTQQFLSSISLRFPRQLADFLFARVDVATHAESFNFHPANYGPYIQIPLRIHESNAATEIFARTWSWLRDSSSRDFYFQQHAANVFDAMFGGRKPDLVSFFETQLETASSDELILMSRLLQKADHDFIFLHRTFVVRLLERCQAVGHDLVKSVSEDLFGSAISGVHSGVPGEPTPLDIEQRDKAIEALSQISRLSPAYGIYDHVRRSADASIAFSRREGEAMDE